MVVAGPLNIEIPTVVILAEILAEKADMGVRMHFADRTSSVGMELMVLDTHMVPTDKVRTDVDYADLHLEEVDPVANAHSADTGYSQDHPEQNFFPIVVPVWAT